MIVKGWGGSFDFLDDCVVIRRTYVLGQVMRRPKLKKQILYSSILAVEAKRPGALNGYIQLIPGDTGSSDENRLQFVNPETFDKAYELLHTKIARRVQVALKGTAATPLVDHLDKLAGLLDRGVLTTEEYNNQQRFLLKIPATHATVDGVADREDPEAIQTDDASRMLAAMDKAIASQRSKLAEPSLTIAAPSFGKRIGMGQPRT